MADELDGLLARAAELAREDGKEAYFRLHRRRFRRILEVLPPPGGREVAVLEIGVNPGQLTALLAWRGYRVWGTDLFPEHRSELWRRLGVEVRRANLDAEPLPYPDETFDWVVFSEVIEHLTASPLDALEEIHRVLKPGGQVLVTTPNQLYLKYRARYLWALLTWRSFEAWEEFQRRMELRREARYYTHAQLYTRRELAWVLERAGFREVTVRFEAPWEPVGVEGWRRRPWAAAGKGLLTLLTALVPPWRSMLLAVGRKG